MAKRRTLFIGVGLLVVLLLGASFAGVLPRLEILGIDDNAKFFNARDFQYRGWYEQYTEVLDSARYTTSIDPNGASEKILVKYQGCDVPGQWVITNANNPADPDYGKAIMAKFFVNGEFSHQLFLPAEFVTETDIQFDCGKGNRFTAPFDTVLTGTETGELKVELWQHMVRLFIGEFDRGWYLVAEDRAALVSGAGACEVSNIKTTGGYEIPFKPGELVEVNCRIGYASSAKLEGGAAGSWKIYGDWQGAALVDLGPGPNIGGIKASFPAPTTTGKHDLTLVNSLWPIYTTHFTVTVNPERAPPPPVVKLDPAGPWLTGMTIAVSWESPVSPVSKSPIATTFFQIEYIDGKLIKEGSAAGAAGGVSFNTGGRNVDIRVVVWSQDQAGEFSAPTQPITEVEGCDLYVSCKGGGTSQGSGGFPLWIIFLLIGVAVILLAIFLPFLPLWPWKIVLILVGGIFIAIAVVLF